MLWCCQKLATDRRGEACKFLATLELCHRAVEDVSAVERLRFVASAVVSSAAVMTFCSVALCCAVRCDVVIVRRIPPPVVYLVAEIGLFEEDARELVTGTHGMLSVCDIRVVRSRVNLKEENLLSIDSTETLYIFGRVVSKVVKSVGLTLLDKKS